MMRYTFDMTRKPTLKRDDPEQSQRFIDTAKAVEADKSDKELDSFMKKISSLVRNRPLQNK